MIEGLTIGNYVKGCTGAIIKVDEVAMNFIKSSPKLYQPIILTGDLANLIGCNTCGITCSIHTYEKSKIYFNGNIVGEAEYLHQYQNTFKKITGNDFVFDINIVIDYFILNLKNARPSK